MTSKHLISSKLTIALLVVLLSFLGNIKYKQWTNQRKIEKEKTELMKQAAELGEKNQDLKNSLAYFNSDAFKERIARQQLNLKKEGEIVFSFTENKSLQAATATPADAESNIDKWRKYFFSNN